MLNLQGAKGDYGCSFQRPHVKFDTYKPKGFPLLVKGTEGVLRRATKSPGKYRAWGRGGKRMGLTKDLCYDIITTEVVNGGALMR